MKQYSFAHPNVFYFPKNFLIDAIDRKLEAFQTAGLIEYWTYNQLSNRRSLDVSSSKIVEPKKLKLDQLLVTFYVLLIGFIFSFVAFAFEVFEIDIKRFFN